MNGRYASARLNSTIINTILCLCNEGDEVILPAPYWVSYIEMIKFAGAHPMIINTDETTSYKITPHQLQQVITPRTKLLILNYPSNPTGMIYSEKELAEIGEILVKNKILCHDWLENRLCSGSSGYYPSYVKFAGSFYF